MATPQDSNDLAQHLLDHIQFLKSSAQAYDSGFEAEAKRMAVTLRLLLHDTGQSHSLLKQTHLKAIPFLDSAHAYDPQNPITQQCLLQLKFSYGGGKPAKAEFWAPLEDRPPIAFSLKPFEVWWTAIVLSDNYGNTFSRRDIVLNVANKDGGAHVDPKLNEAYYSLTRTNTSGWSVTQDGKKADIDNKPAAPSIRQISFEVLRTLKAAGIE